MIFWRGRICIYLQVVFRHEGTKALRNTKVLPRRKEEKEITQRCFFGGGMFRHEGSKKHEGFAAEKRGKGDYAEMFFWRGMFHFIETVAPTFERFKL